VNDIDPTCGQQDYIASMYRYDVAGQGAPSATNVPPCLFAGILWLTAAAGIAQASDVYKSIDANGNVVYSDHLDSSMSQSTPVQIENSGFPPREMHFCWTSCFTLILENGAYRRTDGTDESWTVETFSAGKGSRRARLGADEPVNFNASMLEYDSILQEMVPVFGPAVSELFTKKRLPQSPPMSADTACAARIYQLEAILRRSKATAGLLIDAALR
jgi:hypothetical protein